MLDCDVLQADGGTRTAAITGAYVALADAVDWSARARCAGQPLIDSVAAVSVGVVGGVPMLDLCYEEDVRADTDMNVVMTGDGRYVEVQGTAEGEPFDRAAARRAARAVGRRVRRAHRDPAAALAVELRSAVRGAGRTRNAAARSTGCARMLADARGLSPSSDVEVLAWTTRPPDVAETGPHSPATRC